MEETKYWKWLSMVFGTGSRRVWEIMCLFETAPEAYKVLTEHSFPVSLDEREQENVDSITLKQAEDELEKYRKNGIGAVGYSDSRYPEQLRYLFNPPSVLYYKGNIDCLCGTKTITSVGTRNASEYGLRAASVMCGELAAKHVVVVSGFAVGIDIASHLAAAEKGFPTVCVMGCGVDVNYPKPNEKYRDVILANGGVFISEYPPETQPLPQNFPKRNRILAALGRVSLVFEASQKSGSLITARLAAEQGREVFVIPPSDIFDSRFSGNAELLSEGASLLLGSENIMDCFRFGSPVEIEIRNGTKGGYSLKSTGIVWEGRSAVIKERTEITEIPVGKPKKVRKKTEKTQQSVSETETETEIKPSEEFSDDGLTDIQQKIVREIGNGKLHADEICTRLDLDSAVLMTELTELEILGKIRSLPGKMYETEK